MNVPPTTEPSTGPTDTLASLVVATVPPDDMPTQPEPSLAMTLILLINISVPSMPLSIITPHTPVLRRIMAHMSRVIDTSKATAASYAPATGTSSTAPPAAPTFYAPPAAPILRPPPSAPTLPPPAPTSIPSVALASPESPAVSSSFSNDDATASHMLSNAAH
ncbi:lysine-rich arabinogalactan protein 19-like [Malania oleifera]|uniref:lysine-rich arabinogalactan protein 19-like n=1 Tax=Malania oleifera TaxID=397392 RepID=UPI0025ADD2AC|nr:lysine-rich arabinogalactan protein 19-like [Malania oleifera]